jgi:cysteine desulfurase / selenocysteine lyase
MTIAELLSNEDLRRHEFPIVQKTAYLAHAGVCPLPRRVAEAVRTYAAQCTLGDQEEIIPNYLVRQTRELAARLLNCDMMEISLVGPTSLGLSFVSAGLPWERGDNVVIYYDDFPSNVYPWMALADRGVEVRRVRASEPGCITLESVLEQVDERTRLVALGSCHYIGGYRLDLNAIGHALHERNVLFCVDGIQTLGAFPLSVEHIDFLASDAHKWLLGPCAAGIFYVRKSLQETLRPAVYGWHNVRCPGFVAQSMLVLPPDGRRYEAGTENFLGLIGLHAAMEMLLEVGIENIAAELLRKRSWFVPALQKKGYTVLNANAATPNASAIVSISREDTDFPALHETLSRANIVTSVRGDGSGQVYLRFSPHFYNTDAELQRALDLL